MFGSSLEEIPTIVEDLSNVATERTGEETGVSTTENDTENFSLTFATGNSKAIFSIGANAKTWRKGVDWVNGPMPLGLKIAYREKKRQTPLVQRLDYLQKQMTKKARGRKLEDPHFLNQKFYVSVHDGELLNQTVRNRSNNLSYF